MNQFGEAEVMEGLHGILSGAVVAIGRETTGSGTLP